VRSGKLRGLATTGAGRTVAAPELPTMIEAGVAGFDISTWFGFVAPSGTPRSIIDRLNGETRQMLTLPATAQRFAAFGIDLLPSTPEQMAERIRVDLPLWTKIVRDAGIEPE
jgi:tripartite-type tricarboxylate transporter receptor subunit TctC